MGRKPSIPTYRRRVLGTRQYAVVALGDAVTGQRREFVLGDYGTPESRQAYTKLLAGWESRGRQLSPVKVRAGGPRVGLSVAQLAAAFAANNLTQYSDSERGNFMQALRVLIDTKGNESAETFGPNALRDVRRAMVVGDEEADPPREPWCRNSCNQQTGRLRAVFKWGVANELIPPSVLEGLRALEPLKRGQSDARETEPVRPVATEHVDATLEFLRPPVRAMVELQRVTGMRPGEVAIMRPIDIDMSGPIWLYRPQRHKTEHHGHDRRIALGPRAQEVIRPFLSPSVEAYLFQPGQSVDSMRVERAAARQTPAGQGNGAGTNRKESPRRGPGGCYTNDSYRRAIVRATDRANAKAVKLAIAAGQEIQPGQRLVPSWHPHQLRHSYATEVRKQFGIEAARVALGHTTISMAELYAERDVGVLVEVAKRMG